MSRAAALTEIDLERELLRQSVGRMGAGRYVCADCGRTPLIGESIHSYALDTVVCELCRPRHTAPPDASHPVRHHEFGMTVRVTDRRAR
jgi:DNA-directed RNA polymerase subunit RPC12/RpoP